jgi:AIR synthase-related protein
MNLAELTDKLRQSRGFAHKKDIARVSALLAQQGGDMEFPNGDDCAVIADKDGYLLFAIEGFLNDFVAQDPWFAGYCAVMVNASDVYAMGGRPVAVIDAIWSDGADKAAPVLQGILDAAKVYGIPLVGGHTNYRNPQGQLAAAILGRAKSLLSSFAAEPGQVLIAAIDLRGRYREPYPYWDASTKSPAERLRGDLEVLPVLAELGYCKAAKDISMGGVLGSALMMLEASQIGAAVDLTAIPRPEGVALERWLQSFPSYGYVLSVHASSSRKVLELFEKRSIGAAVIGNTNDSLKLALRHADQESVLWDLREESLIGFAKTARGVINA